jgi:hypothetical protein
MKRGLSTIMREMQLIKARGGGDKEADHSEADKLLCEALELIANENLVGGRRYAVLRLVNTYNEIGKWYA